MGVGLLAGSLETQRSTNSVSSRGKTSLERTPRCVEVDVGGNVGGGSLTMRWRSSSMLICVDPAPPPSRLTPCRLFRREERSAAPALPPPLGWCGEKVPSRSSSFSSPLPASSVSLSSAKGNRPRAISMMEMPRDHTSDLTLYCPPWMRSGWEWRVVSWRAGGVGRKTEQTGQ